MHLLHPQIAPWRRKTEHGLSVMLLVREARPLRAWLRLLPDNEEELIEMAPAGERHGHLCYQAELPWDGGNPATLYSFKLQFDGGQAWLAADGPHRHVPPEAVHFRALPGDEPPDWLARQVFYQVFPDRFCRGQPGPLQRDELHPQARDQALIRHWNEPVPLHRPTDTFYGGDLPGVIQQLDYLQHELGVTALYLNPVFSSPSNHRYDTSDYHQVDPALGGDAALQALCEALRERGMRLVLDAVINHTGNHHPWYTDPAAETRAWYAFDDAGRVRGWKGYDSLPVLDYAQPAVRRAMYEAPGSVLQRWMEPPYAIDGWRLDAIHMLGEGAGSRHNDRLMREIRRAVKQHRPDACLLGEHFFEATRWLQGDQEDGAMNYYGFAHPVRAWLAGLDGNGHPIALSTPDFERWLTRARTALPFAQQLAQLNLLGSHDTARLLTLLDGDVEAMQLALTLLMTYPGVPCLYYGDEIGLQGGPDPDCRRCFDWRRPHWNHRLFEHSRELVRLRRSRPELSQGEMLTLACSGEVYAYVRYDAEAATLVAVNRGEACGVTLDLTALPLPPCRWQPAQGATAVAPAGQQLRLELPRRGAAVLCSQPG
ncbi:maltodextrin glucosidase [Eleftheria terrae]|uniref:maltodextrin glucosidase n=1 Tax=Eleftheria terrae TaxID=1597781 RepID=UPI00263AF166|nr:maltodextrin glucosidase [Eleftheria terrae]WKB50990.1 maltodextrin glucosidase [Eleftheria terrae]